MQDYMQDSIRLPQNTICVWTAAVLLVYWAKRMYLIKIASPIYYTVALGSKTVILDT